MENKELKQLEELMVKLDAAGDDESAIEKAFTETVEVSNEEAELTETDLDDVAGGIAGEIKALQWLIENTKLGKLSWKGTKVCARCLYDYAKYGNAYKTYSKSYVQGLNKQFDKEYQKLPKWLRDLMS